MSGRVKIPVNQSPKRIFGEKILFRGKIINKYHDFTPNYQTFFMIALY